MVLAHPPRPWYKFALQAGLFSAVTSAFILDVQDKLEPDFQEMSYDLLKIIASASLGNIPTGADAAFPQWTGPDPTIVHVQATLYSSLAASLLSAFLAMLGKQWLTRYAQVDMRGSVVDRSRYRQRKINGMATWHFDLVMECLPLMLQAALLLLGYALSNYLFFVDEVVASVIIGFAGFGLLFYFLIASAATLSYNCPFQTPLSLIIRYLINFDHKHRRYLGRTKQWFKRVFSYKKWKVHGPKHGGSGPPRAHDWNNSVDHTELFMPGPPDQPSTLFNKETDWEGYVLDSDCITWMFEMSMDMDIIMAIMKFIPEVVWHAGIQTTPLQRLYDTVLECFDHSSGHPTVIPKFRDRAYLAAKALLHLAIQRKCIGDEHDTVVFDSISNKHLPLAPTSYNCDSDLASTLSIIDCVFGHSKSIQWQDFSFTPPHHLWMGHILLYRAWDVLGQNQPLPDDIKQFVLYSFHLDPPPPAPIIADCLFIVSLALGIPLHKDDLSAMDKR